ncbi:MAG TPA: glycerophosphodiester phosphodiesterase family protein [Acetivibrio clariflavus]|nr:glycerophosphodiester phosphodiesterase family protein [Acetivibrio clariflavus]HPU42264.1 glycerophosphodiester phosphodiesterase family protein [Acetivibrio clariflavus]
MKKFVLCIFLSTIMLFQSNNYIYGADNTNRTTFGKLTSGNYMSGNSIVLANNISTDKIISVTHDKGYIFAVKGTIPVKQIKFTAKLQDFTSKTVYGDQGQWYFSNSSVAQYSNGQINILKKGVTKATFVINGVSTSLMLFAKESEEDSYVLYEENFDSLVDGSLPSGWIRKDGANGSNTYVKNGALYIDGRLGAARVLLPEYLSKFGNYVIEADVTNLSANDDMSWGAIMYRIQKNDYPYYQMTVKKKATAANGTEFAEKDVNNNWIVGKINFFYEDINESKMYHYTIKAYNNIVEQWIGNVMLMSVDTWGIYPTGGIGFQASGCIMKVDNLKVSLLEEQLGPVKSPEDNFARVKEVNTKIAMAPTLVSEIKSKEEFDRLISYGQVGTIILSVNKNLEIIGRGSNDVIGTVASFYEAMKSKIIPAFRVNDFESAQAISKYLKDNGIEDVFVISKYPDLVREARKNYAFIRGIVEFESLPSNLDTNQLLNIVSFANRNLSRIVLIPSEAATKSNVRYLQQRLITVWTKDTAKDNGTEKVVNLHRIITSGSNGILTDSVEKAVQALAVYNKNTTIIRKPFLIGHRGVPQLAPENTIEGAELAFTLGADMVENDIWLTKAGADGKQHLVVIHDETLECTTNGKGKVSEMTLEQVRNYLANNQFKNKYPTARIPTLAQYFEKFNSRDKTILVEIKGKDTKTADSLAELIKNTRSYAQAIAISSNNDQLKRIKALMPEISLGNIRAGYDYKSDAYGALRYALWEVQSLDSCLMPNCESISKDFMEIAKHRGMTIWPWNINDISIAIHFFKMGAWGISTDFAYLFSDWAADITPKQTNVYMKIGELSLLEANIKTYNGTVKSVIPEVVVIGGDDCIEVIGSLVKGKKPGTVYVLLRYTARLSQLPEDVYDLYTEPVRIQVG